MARCEQVLKSARNALAAMQVSVKEAATRGKQAG
ncbi:hypothetical protein L245_30215 [Salmonella enterica subsp. enterica serovar Worthington str. BCH-4719]|nr:hypothetical protein L245_30215 [Salmonella enterica subsp. enterica serovar Worthington str. BCH-4719]